MHSNTVTYAPSFIIIIHFVQKFLHGNRLTKHDGTTHLTLFMKVRKAKNCNINGACSTTATFTYKQIICQVSRYIGHCNHKHVFAPFQVINA
jgi:hypothetical protein